VVTSIVRYLAGIPQACTGCGDSWITKRGKRRLTGGNGDRSNPEDINWRARIRTWNSPFAILIINFRRIKTTRAQSGTRVCFFFSVSFHQFPLIPFCFPFFRPFRLKRPITRVPARPSIRPRSREFTVFGERSQPAVQFTKVHARERTRTKTKTRIFGMARPRVAH